jgi:YVTN family beta-propeller protein
VAVTASTAPIYGGCHPAHHLRHRACHVEGALIRIPPLARYWEVAVNIVARRRGLRLRAALILAALLVTASAAIGVAVATVSGTNPFGTQRVGRTVSGAILLPTNQWISPLGTRILDRNARLVSSTLSPNGNDVAALGWNEFSGFLTIIDLRTKQIVQQTPLSTPADKPTDTTVAADGPLYSPDGTTLWVPQTTYLLRFTVNPTTGTATETAAIALCGNGDVTSRACDANADAGAADGSELPSGMALSPDGSRLYVALNGANGLGVINTATNTLIQTIPVGNAPRQVVLADNGTVAYVSNEGGRRARPGQFTNMSDGTPIVSDRVTGAATTGTVSVVNLTTGTETREIPVGLQPTALFLHGAALFVANSNDDSMSVIDTATNRVAQTVSTNPVPGARIGSYANAITMPDARHVLVSIGRDNAIAQYRYRGLSKPLTYQGLMPTDFYPVQVQADPALGNQIVVTNDKGIGARGPVSTIDKGPRTKKATAHNTYDDTGSVTIFKLPTPSALKADTKTVFANNTWNLTPALNAGAADTVPTVIPRKLGGSSPIKHVVVIVKENRTYDQVLGDLGEGSGDPALAQFGRNVTPNLHALARRFGDLDNFYDEGTLSADGHNWLMQANANDYNEKEFGAFYRSYPSQGGDALAYQRDGFLWNAAERAGKSVQVYGEYAHNPFSQPPPSWDEWYRDSQILEGKAKGRLPVPTHKFRTTSDIPSLNRILDPWFPNFQLNIPDQYRVDMWEPIFKRQEKTGHLPALTFMWLMTDHTAGVGTGDPFPVAENADNDLAVGRVVDEITHSRFWKSTAIFVLEDDPQNGVDHTDGHRSVLWTISPYSEKGVDNQYYTQLNVVRTIEQILGITPMNQMDRAAIPIYHAFTAKPNFAPFDALAARIPLTLGAPGFPSQITHGALAGTGSVPAAEEKVFQAWVAWSRHQRFNGRRAAPDTAKPALLNRLDWYSAHNWTVAYPGDAKIYAPNQVPGRDLPAAFLGDG